MPEPYDDIPPDASDDPTPPVCSDALIAQLYEQLRALAQQRLNAERAGHTLSATALLHEAYLKVAGPHGGAWQSRAHFCAAAVEAMRRVLVDHARARGRLKRGKGRKRVDLDLAATLPATAEQSADLIALDKAICRLKSQEPRSAEVVRLRYFGGLSNAETAAVLGISERTVKSDWSFAKAWLRRALRDE